MTEAAARPPRPVGDSKAPPRTGPRPLALHLATALTTWLSSVAVLPIARDGSLPWHPKVAAKAAALLDELSTEPAEALIEAAGAEAMDRLGAMLEGIDAYRHHPYARNLDDAPVIWREGSTRLLDYGPFGAGSAVGRTLLVVPSLVNRGYVLDLTAERSLLRYLAQKGFRPLLVDWGAPGLAERDFDLGDYVAGRLEAALDEVLRLDERPPGLVGYCMGGNLALALAHRRQAHLASLVLLATPWDFHAERGSQARLFAIAEPAVETVLEAFGELPVDMLQAFFAALDPNLAGRKFRAFARLDPDSAAAAHFVALEDWLNDGVPLAAKVARECLVGWYGANMPGEGKWAVRDCVVRPKDVTLATLLAVPSSDRIVPPGSARALAGALRRSDLLVPPSGHIGMVVGGQARRGLWEPLCAWLDGAGGLAP